MKTLNMQNFTADKEIYQALEENFAPMYIKALRLAGYKGVDIRNTFARSVVSKDVKKAAA